MIRSMTGYGAAESELADGRVLRAEVRTVNPPAPEHQRAPAAGVGGVGAARGGADPLAAVAGKRVAFGAVRGYRWG